MGFFLFGLSGGEIFIVVMLFLLLFGGKRIPEMAKTIGHGMREFKKATNQIRDEIELSSVENIDDVDVLSDVPSSQKTLKDSRIKQPDYDAGDGI
jgi:sec-independent protein translocase protein TatA